MWDSLDEMLPLTLTGKLRGLLLSICNYGSILVKKSGHRLCAGHFRASSSQSSILFSPAVDVVVLLAGVQGGYLYIRVSQTMMISVTALGIFMTLGLSSIVIPRLFLFCYVGEVFTKGLKIGQTKRMHKQEKMWVPVLAIWC